MDLQKVAFTFIRISGGGAARGAAAGWENESGKSIGNPVSDVVHLYGIPYGIPWHSLWQVVII